MSTEAATNMIETRIPARLDRLPWSRFLNALLTRAARDKSVRPPGLEDFRRRLARTISGTPGDISTDT